MPPALPLPHATAAAFGVPADVWRRCGAKDFSWVAGRRTREAELNEYQQLDREIWAHLCPGVRIRKTQLSGCPEQCGKAQSHAHFEWAFEKTDSGSPPTQPQCSVFRDVFAGFPATAHTGKGKRQQRYTTLKAIMDVPPPPPARGKRAADAPLQDGDRASVWCFFCQEHAEIKYQRASKRWKFFRHFCDPCYVKFASAKGSASFGHSRVKKSVCETQAGQGIVFNMYKSLEGGTAPNPSLQLFCNAVCAVLSTDITGCRGAGGAEARRPVPEALGNDLGKKGVPEAFWMLSHMPAPQTTAAPPPPPPVATAPTKGKRRKFVAADAAASAAPAASAGTAPTGAADGLASKKRRLSAGGTTSTAPLPTSQSGGEPRVEAALRPHGQASTGLHRAPTVCQGARGAEAFAPVAEAPPSPQPARRRGEVHHGDRDARGDSDSDGEGEGEGDDDDDEPPSRSPTPMLDDGDDDDDDDDD